jgi:hypothetical protein
MRSGESDGSEAPSPRMAWHIRQIPMAARRRWRMNYRSLWRRVIFPTYVLSFILRNIKHEKR